MAVTLNQNGLTIGDSSDNSITSITKFVNTALAVGYSTGTNNVAVTKTIDVTSNSGNDVVETLGSMSVGEIKSVYYSIYVKPPEIWGSNSIKLKMPSSGKYFVIKSISNSHYESTDDDDSDFVLENAAAFNYVQSGSALLGGKNLNTQYKTTSTSEIYSGGDELYSNWVQFGTLMEGAYIRITYFRIS